jgi:hypothetical protein
VQRGTQDAMRGRALTFVMSATWTSTGVGILLAGALMSVNDARWVWLASAITLAGASIVGFTLAREPAGRGAPLEAPAG